MPRGISPMDEYNLQDRLWSPYNMQKPPVMFHTTSDRSTLKIVSGGISQIASWRCALGSANTWIASGSQPWITTVNGMIAVSGFGAPSYFTMTGSFNLGAGPSTMVMVGAGAGTSVGTITVDKRCLGTGTNGRVGMPFPGGGGTDTNIPYSYYSTGNIIVGRLTPNGTGYNSSFFTDGANAGGDVYPATTTPANPTCTLLDTNATSPSGDYVFADMLFDRIITAREQYLVSGWAAWQFNQVKLLDYNHPFKYRPPLLGD